MTETQFINTLKKDRYLGSIFSYGIVTLLYLLQEHELNENYEECQLIFEVIRDFNQHRGMVYDNDLPTNIRDINVDEYVKESLAFFHLKPVNYYYNLPEYIQCIKDEINSIKK